MTNTAIAADFYQSLDVQCDLTAQIAFHMQLLSMYSRSLETSSSVRSLDS